MWLTVTRVDWQQQPTVRIKQNAWNKKPQQQRTHLESANEFYACRSSTVCFQRHRANIPVLGGILCLFSLPWLRQVAAANRIYSTAGRNPSLISIAIRTFHSHCMRSVFQKSGCEPSNVGEKITLFLPRRTVQPLIRFLRASHTWHIKITTVFRYLSTTRNILLGIQRKP